MQDEQLRDSSCVCPSSKTQTAAEPVNCHTVLAITRKIVTQTTTSREQHPPPQGQERQPPPFNSSNSAATRSSLCGTTAHTVAHAATAADSSSQQQTHTHAPTAERHRVSNMQAQCLLQRLAGPLTEQCVLVRTSMQPPSIHSSTSTCERWTVSDRHVNPGTGNAVCTPLQVHMLRPPAPAARPRIWAVLPATAGGLQTNWCKYSVRMTPMRVPHWLPVARHSQPVC